VVSKRSGTGGVAGGSATPSDDQIPQVTPRDLHPTSDIRFVMVELGKLTSTTSRLVADVEKLDTHIQKLNGAFNWAKGFAIAAVVLVPLCAGIIWWLIGGELTQIRDKLYSLPPPAQTQIQQQHP
jgi:hypothetical protein